MAAEFSYTILDQSFISHNPVHIPIPAATAKLRIFEITFQDANIFCLPNFNAIREEMALEVFSAAR